MAISEILALVATFDELAEAFEAVNGYDSELILGEDWDMHRRLKSKFSVGRIEAKALHNTKYLPMIFNLKKAKFALSCMVPLKLRATIIMLNINAY